MRWNKTTARDAGRGRPATPPRSRTRPSAAHPPATPFARHPPPATRRAGLVPRPVNIVARSLKLILTTPSGQSHEPLRHLHRTITATTRTRQASRTDRYPLESFQCGSLIREGRRPFHQPGPPHAAGGRVGPPATAYRYAIHGGRIASHDGQIASHGAIRSAADGGRTRRRRRRVRQGRRPVHEARRTVHEMRRADHGDGRPTRESRSPSTSGTADRMAIGTDECVTHGRMDRVCGTFENPRVNSIESTRSGAAWANRYLEGWIPSVQGLSSGRPTGRSGMPDSLHV